MDKNKDLSKILHSESEICPHCNANLKEDEIIVQFKRFRDEEKRGFAGKTDAELEKSAELYGWTKENKLCSSKLIGVELPYDDPDHYDGISFWVCPECGVGNNRFNDDITNNYIHLKKKNDEEIK